MIPVRLAEKIAGMAARNHVIVLIYGVGLFLVLPLLGVFLIR
jgi:hypothetical protein